jgi:hypothetical protein
MTRLSTLAQQAKTASIETCFLCNTTRWLWFVEYGHSLNMAARLTSPRQHMPPIIYLDDSILQRGISPTGGKLRRCHGRGHGDAGMGLQ